MTVQLTDDFMRQNGMSGILPKPRELTDHRRRMDATPTVERFTNPSPGNMPAVMNSRSAMNGRSAMNDGVTFVKTRSVVPIDGSESEGVDYSAQSSEGDATATAMPSALLAMPASAKEWAVVAAGAIIFAVATRKMLNTGPVLTIASVIAGAIAGKYVSQKI